MRVRLKSVFAICFFIVFLFTIACQNRTKEWKGNITDENGIMVVHNPKGPMYGEDVLVLEEDLSIGEIPTDEGDYLFSQIRSITVDEAENIYILDSKEKPQGMKLAIPRYHGAFQWIMTDDEGRIFVMTEERSPKSNGYYHDVFGSEGRYLVKIPLASRPIVIKKDKFYTVTEDKNGFHTVKRYKAIWRVDE